MQEILKNTQSAIPKKYLGVRIELSTNTVIWSLKQYRQLNAIIITITQNKATRTWFALMDELLVAVSHQLKWYNHTKTIFL